MGLFSKEKKVNGIPNYYNTPPCPPQKLHPDIEAALQSDVVKRNSGRIKSLVFTHETFHTGQTGYGETVAKPKVVIEFYERDEQQAKYVAPPPNVNTNTPV